MIFPFGCLVCSIAFLSMCKVCTKSTQGGATFLNRKLLSTETFAVSIYFLDLLHQETPEAQESRFTAGLADLKQSTAYICRIYQHIVWVCVLMFTCICVAMLSSRVFF